MSDQLTKAAEAEYPHEIYGGRMSRVYVKGATSESARNYWYAKFQEEQAEKPIVSELQLCPKCNANGFISSTF